MLCFVLFCFTFIPPLLYLFFPISLYFRKSKGPNKELWLCPKWIFLISKKRELYYESSWYIGSNLFHFFWLLMRNEHAQDQWPWKWARALGVLDITVSMQGSETDFSALYKQHHWISRYTIIHSGNSVRKKKQNASSFESLLKIR